MATFSDNFNIAKDYMQKQLESHGLYIESNTSGSGLSISLTQFGLSTAYADITEDEISYFIDNIDDELAQELGIKGE